MLRCVKRSLYIKCLSQCWTTTFGSGLRRERMAGFGGRRQGAGEFMVEKATRHFFLRRRCFFVFLLLPWEITNNCLLISYVALTRIGECLLDSASAKGGCHASSSSKGPSIISTRSPSLRWWCLIRHCQVIRRMPAGLLFGLLLETWYAEFGCCVLLNIIFSI